MGVVKSQAINNSIFNYIGQVIGYVNVIVLFPILLTQEEFGLTRLLASMAIIYAQLSSFGTQRVIIKFFPFFQAKEGADHHGFLSLVLFNTLLGFILVSATFWFLKDLIVDNQESQLFKSFYISVPLLSALTLLNWVFESYLKVLLKTSFTSFLNNILLKILWLGSALAYYYEYLNIEQFIWVYCSVHLMLVIAMVAYLGYLKQLSFKLNFYYYKWRLLKNIYRYGAYSILDNTNSALMNNLDKIMLGFLVMDDLRSVAVYTVASHLSGIVIIPSTSMNRILTPLISRHWKKKQREKIETIYRQSTIINLVLTGSLFVLVWTNIDGIMNLVDKDYASGIYAILFLMLSRLIGVSFGLNGDILLVSKHYWFNTVSGGILIFLMIIFNYLFIPIYGVIGAALGTLVARTLYNLIRHFFLYNKEKLNPFTIKNLHGLIILSIVLTIGSNIHFKGLHFLIEMILKGTIVAALLFFPLYYMKISKDLNLMFDNAISKLKRLLTRG